MFAKGEPVRLLAFLAFFTGASGCFIGFVAPAPVCCVTLVLVVNPGLFARSGVLAVDVWNASQLATLDDNARCARVSGPGGMQMQCPPGVTYEDVMPERLQYELSSMGSTLEVTPKQVAPGERFRIHLSGPSRDRCNATSADVVQTAQQGRTALGGLSWRTTLRACVTP